MPKLLEQDSNLKYEFTDAEMMQVLYFSPLQLMYFRDQRSRLMEQKASLTVDPAKLHEFVQKEAELGGMIQIFTSLLEGHENAVADLLRAKREAAGPNSQMR